MEWALAYILLGAIAGFLGGLFGIGGGAILVPVLLFLFEAQRFPTPDLMHLALGTSMATILFTSVSSAYKHHRHGAVNWRVVRIISPGILICTSLGALSAVNVSPKFLGIFFSLFVYFAAALILLDAKPTASRPLPSATGMTMVGIFTGWLSTLVSIGGGTVVVPFLVWCNVALRNAIGTSAAVGFTVAIGGTLGYIVIGSSNTGMPAHSLGFVYLPALLWVALASVLTAPLGAQAAHRMKVWLLRKLFAVMLIALATVLLLKIM